MRAGDGDALLARAGDLLEPGADFAPLVISPLLIPRVRSSGGVGGRRVSAGVARGDAGGGLFAVLVEDHRAGRSLRALSSATACAHAYNDELRRAARDGLAARPAAQVTSAAALLDAGRALLG